MTERSYVYDQRFGLRRTMIYDDEKPEEFTVKTEQKLDEVIDNNAILRERRPRGAIRLLARGVPITVYEQSIREQWDESDWAKWLNDPDNAVFRIEPGRV